MFYDLANIVDIFLCGFSLFLWVKIIRNSRKKIFIPPIAKDKQLWGVYSLLGLSCVCLGITLRGIRYNLYTDNASIVFGILACISLYVAANRFYILSIQKELTIRDADYIQSTTSN